MGTHTVEIRGLSFRYDAALPLVLDGVDLRARAGMRLLLIGANGAGKSTLLRVIAGRHMVPPEAVRVLDRSAFHDTSLSREVVFLGGTFPFTADVPVARLVAGVRGADPARRDELVEMLDVDPAWSMRRVSDGQRRRVQILLGLLRRPRVLLLDEVTTDLDVIARQDLLTLLRRDTERNGVTIVYATHIFDSLEEWATDLAYLDRGRIALCEPLARVADLQERIASGHPAPLLRTVEHWLRRDR